MLILLIDSLTSMYFNVVHVYHEMDFKSEGVADLLLDIHVPYCYTCICNGVNAE